MTTISYRTPHVTPVCSGRPIKFHIRFPISKSGKDKDLKEIFNNRLKRIKSHLSCAVFIFDNQPITKNTSLEKISRIFNQILIYIDSGNIPEILVYFCFKDDTICITPKIEIKQSLNESTVHSRKATFLHIFDELTDIDLWNSFHQAFVDFVTRYYAAVLYYNGDIKLSPYSYLHDGFAYVVFFPKSIDHATEAQLRLKLNQGQVPSSDPTSSFSLPSRRTDNGERLMQTCAQLYKLPIDKPYFRRGQALQPVPSFSKHLGPRPDLLVCPHHGIKVPSDSPGGKTSIVQGRYTYKHYMQDGVNDKGWGCAYRSLQTLVSWLAWQGEINTHRLPSIADIQATLVRIGDKPASFSGSRQWIGSLEISFCIETLYNIQCQVIPLNSGSQMGDQMGPVLADHFSSGGGPVMIGGGQLAHTIIGVHLPERDLLLDGLASSSRKPSSYLVLDPHFVPPHTLSVKTSSPTSVAQDYLKQVQDKGWVGWKVGSTFWKAKERYNLCLLPPVKPNCP